MSNQPHALHSSDFEIAKINKKNNDDDDNEIINLSINQYRSSLHSCFRAVTFLPFKL